MDKHRELLYAKPAALEKLTRSLIEISTQASGDIRKKKNEHGKIDANVIVIPGKDGNNTPSIYMTTGIWIKV